MAYLAWFYDHVIYPIEGPNRRELLAFTIFWICVWGGGLWLLVAGMKWLISKTPRRWRGR